MKKLIFLLALLPSTVFAQSALDIYRVATPAQVLPFNSSVGTWVITTPIFHRYVELTCSSASCYVSFAVSGTSVPATKTTGTYLPADIPKRYVVNKDSKIYVIGGSGSGSLHVQELSK